MKNHQVVHRYLQAQVMQPMIVNGRSMGLRLVEDFADGLWLGDYVLVKRQSLILLRLLKFARLLLTA